MTSIQQTGDRIPQLLGESAALYGFISSRVGGDRALAEDLTQETLLSALEGAYDAARGPLRSWLFGIAIRKIVDGQRRKRIDRRHQAAAARDLSLRLTRELLPAEWAQRQEIRCLVNEALARIPEAAALLLVRKYFDGASVGDLAAERDQTEKATESQLTRARVLFQEALEGLSRPEDEP